MKKFYILLIALFSIASFAQKKQAIVISNKYEFQKQKNSYNINNVLKAILVSNHFQVYFDDEVLPVEIAQNRCDVLTGVLLDKSNMFLTKIKLQLKDCQNNVVFETADVKSREKDIQTAYMEAIKLLSPELKKYKATLIQKKDVVVTPSEIIEKPKISEFKTYLNCRIVEEFSNGVNVVDADQSQILNLLKTRNPNIYIALKGELTGILTVTNNKGIFEYYFDGKYMVEEFLF